MGLFCARFLSVTLLPSLSFFFPNLLIFIKNFSWSLNNEGNISLNFLLKSCLILLSEPEFVSWWSVCLLVAPSVVYKVMVSFLGTIQLMNFIPELWFLVLSLGFDMRGPLVCWFGVAKHFFLFLFSSSQAFVCILRRFATIFSPEVSY